MRNYDDYTRSFAELVSQILASLTERCRVHKKGEEPSTTFIDDIREAWSKRVKPLADADHNRHETLVKGLGQYYGALVTQLAAIDAKWKQVAADCKNPLIDLDRESAACCAEALTRALAISDAAFAYAAALKQAENQLLSRAMLFCQQAESYVRRMGLIYKSSQYSDFGYEIHGIGTYVCPDGTITCQFYYWDGADEIGSPIFDIFPKEEHKQEVRRLAELCLGGFGTLSDNLSRITIARSVPLVKVQS